MTDIVFTIRLSEADWDDNMRAWRCPALAIPGAAVDALYIAGERVDSARYEALMPHAIIRWVMGERPERATASIALTEALSLGRDTERWKKIAIVLPVLATILAAVVTAGAPILARSLGWLDRSITENHATSGSGATAADNTTTATRATAGPINNTIEQARAIKLGDLISVDANGERWFRFDIKNLGAARITISGTVRYGNSIRWFKLFNSTGEAIIYTYFGSQASQASFISPRPETYYIRVAPEGPSADFHVTE